MTLNVNEIKTLKIKHLQAELSSRNLSFAGKKEDLVQRLTTAVLNERSAQTVTKSKEKVSKS